ncbi:MAG TPA: hypothetical protein VMP10_03470, partial [Chloroflexota bacterium]|nr:hypothetical protein [Chloroflexota bacterium]
PQPQLSLRVHKPMIKAALVNSLSASIAETKRQYLSARGSVDMISAIILIPDQRARSTDDGTQGVAARTTHCGRPSPGTLDPFSPEKRRRRRIPRPDRRGQPPHDLLTARRVIPRYDEMAMHRQHSCRCLFGEKTPWRSGFSLIQFALSCEILFAGGSESPDQMD